MVYAISVSPAPLKLTAASPAEEAQKSVRGMEENAIHAKYIELVNIPLLILYIPSRN